MKRRKNIDNIKEIKTNISLLFISSIKVWKLSNLGKYFVVIAKIIIPNINSINPWKNKIPYDLIDFLIIKNLYKTYKIFIVLSAKKYVR